VRTYSASARASIGVAPAWRISSASASRCCSWWPEAAAGGALSKILDGDLVRVDGVQGRLDVLVAASTLEKRQIATMPHSDGHGMGRELFAGNRMRVSSAETGALSIM
jgi:dihydroxyacid dehydratase/phosphogluconate dehydratase